MSDARAAWAAAFAAAQGQLPPIPKNRTAKIPLKNGGQFEYNYADLTDIVKAVTGVLTANGLSVAQSVAGEVGTVAVTTRIYHAGGHAEEFGPTVLEARGDARSVGSAITYARRYALAAALGISPDEDDDGALAAQAVQQHRERPTPPTPAQRLATEMAALHDGDVEAARATTVAIAKELEFGARWADDPAAVEAVLKRAAERAQNPSNGGSGPTSSGTAGTSSETDSGGPGWGAEVEQWSALHDLLDKDPILGTVQDIEQRVRQLYMLMRGVGLWPDRTDDSGKPLDELHWALMRDWSVEHVGDLRVKANYQKFAKDSYEAAKAVIEEHTKRDGAGIG